MRTGVVKASRSSSVAVVNLPSLSRALFHGAGHCVLVPKEGKRCVCAYGSVRVLLLFFSSEKDGGYGWSSRRIVGGLDDNVDNDGAF